MSAYFFDTCALKHRYIKTKISSRISRIVSNRRHEIYISELTVVELGSAFADYCKDQGSGHREYDRLYRKFFRDVASRRIIVREITKRDLQNARHLIRFAKVIEGRHLRSADAIVSETCRDLSYELGNRVTFYSCDQKLHTTLNATSAYRSVVRLRYLQP